MPLVAFAALAVQDALLPKFPERWTFLKPLPERREGTTVAQIPPAGSEGFAATGAWIANPPIERELRFSVWIRSGKGGTASINAFAYDASEKLLKPSSVAVKLAAGTWTKAESALVAPKGAKEIRLFVINPSNTPLDVSDPHLVLGGEKIEGLEGRGLLRASGGMPVTGGQGTVLFPIPGPTAEQAPVWFSLRATPTSALEGYDVRRREGDNWICEARVSVPKGDKPVSLRWESLVAVRDLPVSELPKTKIGTADPKLRTWLTSTPVVQADDAGIQAKAKALHADDLETYVRRVIAFTRDNQGTGAPHRTLDAASSLACGGSCTNRANLGAALLRAAGVPARTVSHFPAWAYGSPLYEHWLVEYWHPGAGWTRVETTLGEFAPKASGLAALATASIEDERRTGEAGQKGWIMPGAAWMSGIQGTGDLHATFLPNDPSTANWCRAERRIAVDKPLLDAARAAWPKLATGHPELEETALKGSPDALVAALKKAGS